ncbi:hypothetical protein [Deinococcus hohokamensis]|uniref:Lipoprotein n=1 Tax=Deinococcus hohokamensis TaxID=309883 RepID=A0ABV9IFA5_9DEIO
MRKFTSLALSTMMLVACGMSPTPTAVGSEAASAPQDRLHAQSFETTWAGGRCWFRQSYSDAGGHRYEVRHNNGGYVRLEVKLLAWNTWHKSEQRSYAQYSNVYAAEVYAYCKVDGNWVGGMKYRTD